MFRTFLMLVLLLCCATSGAALDVPQLKARVTDLAGLLTEEQIQNLEAKLRDLERTDSTQVAVLIIPSLEGESLEDYSERTATAWRLGQKGRDNGALLLIAMKERKVRIEVGYGLEPTLTDLKSSHIIQNEIVPRFRAEAYYEGIDAAVTAIIRVVRGQYQLPKSTSPRIGRFVEWALISLVPFLWLVSVTRKAIGILGAGLGVLLALSLFGPSLVALLLGALVGGILGMLLGAMIGSVNRSSHGRTGRTGRWYYGSGGFSGYSGGSGFSIGDFSGGGFSGGGGSFGGGGSSGSW